MNEDDLIRLRHMLDAAREASAFATGKTRQSLDEDRGLTLILIQEITSIGEAASRVSPECAAQYPEIPWAAIVGMRNRLIHAYFAIDLDIVWNTVSIRLPELIATLGRIIPTIPRQQGTN
jgi:uncharacterized protein with HEPN domain